MSKGPTGCQRADLVVVGGGIVGVATARELLIRHPDASVILCEKEPRLAGHQTGHNSGVIHSGIYYAPGSMKAEFCAEGLIRTKEFASEHRIPFRNCGKLLVATDELELERLSALAERAGQNGLDVADVDRAELRRMEPYVSGLGALLVNQTAIIDYRRVTEAMAADFIAAGGQILSGTRIERITESADDVVLAGRSAHDGGGDLTITAGRVVFCTGLQADRMARLAGLETDVSIVPFRGEYYTVSPNRGELVRRLIYPVPDPSLPFLGVHLSPTIDGELTVGPNAVLGLAREGYRKGSVDLTDLTQMVRSPGLWRVARTHLRTGAREMFNSAVKIGYLKAVQKYCPSIQAANLRPRTAGIRAQAMLPDGTLLHDFRIERTERTVHVLNAPSPAATSALPIAAHLSSQLVGVS